MEHVEKRREVVARAPGLAPGIRRMQTIGARGRLGLVVVVAAGLALASWPGRVQAQDGTPARERPETAPDDEPDGAPALAEDDAAGEPASDTAGEDAAWSRDVPPDQQRAAREVFRKANELARKRFFATAATKYKQAIELWPHPAFAYNLALTQLQLDQLIEAHANLERALAHGPAPLAGRYDQARQALARLQSEISPIEVTCAEPGARVMLDGQYLFTAPGEYRGVVRPGAHQLVATRRGLAPVVEQVVASPGERSRVVVAFEYPEVDVEVSTRRWAAWKSYSVVGAGAALLLAGGILDWHSTNMLDAFDRDVRAMCSDGMSCAIPSELAGRRDRAESQQRAALIVYAVGGAALATGAVLTYLGREQTHRKRVRVMPDPAPGSAAGAGRGTLAPLVSPGAIGVRAAFRF